MSLLWLSMVPAHHCQPQPPVQLCMWTLLDPNLQQCTTRKWYFFDIQYYGHCNGGQLSSVACGNGLISCNSNSMTPVQLGGQLNSSAVRDLGAACCRYTYQQAASTRAHHVAAGLLGQFHGCTEWRAKLHCGVHATGVPDIFSSFTWH